MHDDIHFELPLAQAFEPFLGRFFDGDLLRMFRYRHEVLQMDLSGYMKNRERPRKSVLIYGHLSGLTEPLWNFLATQGHKVTFVPDWSKNFSEQQRADLRHYVERGEYQVLINLHNAFLPGQVDWMNSRKVIIGSLAQMKIPFELYFDLIQTQPSGHLIDQWEALCAPLHALSTRCALATHGEVITPAFGVLKKNQSWKDQTKSWIAVDDAVAVIEHCMLFDSISGHVNLTASEAAGETKSSKQITDSGYEYRYCNLKAALKHVLGA